MDGITLAWTLAATVFAGLQIFTQKVVAQERGDSALNGVMGYGVSAIAAGIAAALTTGSSAALVLAALWALGSGTIHGFGSYIRIESLKYIDSVIYFPINKVLGPLMVLAMAVAWFGDKLTVLQYIGIVFSLCVPL